MKRNRKSLRNNFLRWRRLQLEPLESRVLLAVVAGVNNNNALWVNGDGAANTITVTAAGGFPLVTWGAVVIYPIPATPGAPPPPAPVPIGQITTITVDGDAGNDTIDLTAVGGWGNVESVSIVGGFGNDVISGSQYGDIIIGDNPNNLFVGGEDVIFGGKGNDHISGMSAIDILFGNDGFDNLSGGSGNDTLRGGDQNDELDGGEDIDILWGEDGCDTLKGGLENDFLHGMYGDDILTDTDGSNTFDGGTGRDIINGTPDYDAPEGCWAAVEVQGLSGDTTTEWGDTVTFQIRLHAKPDHTVEIPFVSGGGGEGMVGPPQSIFIFPPLWDQWRTVTVNPFNDIGDDGPVAYTIIIGPTISTDLRFHGMTAPSINLVNLDEDLDAKDDLEFPNEDEEISIPVTLNDFDTPGPITRVFIQSPPDQGKGTVRVEGMNIIYTPTKDFNGLAQFRYGIENEYAAHGGVDYAWVKVHVAPQNDEPKANPKDVEVVEDTPKTFTLTGDDGDPRDDEDQVLTFAIVDGPAHGTLSGFDPATGAVTYTPDPNWNSADPNNPGQHIPDSFTFTVTDDNTAGGDALTSEPATVDDHGNSRERSARRRKQQCEHV